MHSTHLQFSFLTVVFQLSGQSPFLIETLTDLLLPLIDLSVSAELSVKVLIRMQHHWRSWR